MSTNRKNRATNIAMMNFTNNIEKRWMVTTHYNIKTMEEKAKEISQGVNKIIQEIMIKTDLVLPFITIKVVEEKDGNNVAVRIVYMSSENKLGTKVKFKQKNNMSHVLEIQESSTYKTLTFSNSDCDAKMVVDEEYIVPAGVDLCLDIAMSNAFSFLKEGTIEDKRTFSKNKFEYFKGRGLFCFYDYDSEDEFSYYSLAYSARKNKTKIDLEKYLELWEDFLKTYYPKCINVMEPIGQQLNKHVDIGQLPRRKILDELDKKPVGSYLLLRINRMPKSEEKRIQLQSLFRGEKVEIGKWTIIPIDDYGRVERYVNELYVSAFKIVNCK